MVTHDKMPEPILLVQPTGSGKSSVPQNVSVVTSGVTFIIECTQSLGSDQASKIVQASTAHGALVYAYQLDVFKTNLERADLSNNIGTVLSEKKHSSVENGIV